MYIYMHIYACKCAHEFHFQSHDRLRVRDLVFSQPSTPLVCHLTSSTPIFTIQDSRNEYYSGNCLSIISQAKQQDWSSNVYTGAQSTYSDLLAIRWPILLKDLSVALEYDVHTYVHLQSDLLVIVYMYSYPHCLHKKLIELRQVFKSTEFIGKSQTRHSILTNFFY